MNDADDPLEVELAALQPREISAELERSISRRLPAVPARRSDWAFAGYGGLAAAALALALLLRHTSSPSPATFNGEKQPWPQQSGDDSLPTLLTYQRVLAKPPEALDKLLDKHAANGLRPAREEPRGLAFAHFDALTGEP